MQVLTSALFNVGCSAIFFASAYLLCYISWLRPTIEGMLAKGPGEITPAKMDSQVARVSNHFMSVIHCIIEIPFAFYVLGQQELQKDHIYGVTPEACLCLCIAAGYFLVDVLIMLIRRDEGPLFMMHGLLCLSLYAYGSVGNMVHFYGAAFLLWEISTPFVHLRWLLSKMGREDSTLYVLNGLAMTAAFFGCRCVWGTYMSIDFWKVSSHELANPRDGGFPAFLIWGFRLTNIALQGLCFYWFYLMLKKAASFLNSNQKDE